MHKVCWRVEPFGMRLLCDMPACGKAVITALLQGLEHSITNFSFVLCPVSFKDLLGFKRLLLYLTGNCVSREVPPVSAAVFALPGEGGSEEEAARCHYLVCWKSDQVPRGTWSRLGQSEKWKHRLGKVIFSRWIKCFGAARGQRNLWAVVFLLDQWLSSCGLFTPGGLWAALRRPLNGN